jgi:hypothetical protein
MDLVLETVGNSLILFNEVGTLITIQTEDFSLELYRIYRQLHVRNSDRNRGTSVWKAIG